MCSSAYLRLKHDKNEYMELCPVAPVHKHEKGGGEPVYFSDLVVNSSKKQVLFVLFYLFTTEVLIQRTGSQLYECFLKEFSFPTYM